VLAFEQGELGVLFHLSARFADDATVNGQLPGEDQGARAFPGRRESALSNELIEPNLRHRSTRSVDDPAANLHQPRVSEAG
jgi:hypothetical protein